MRQSDSGSSIGMSGLEGVRTTTPTMGPGDEKRFELEVLAVGKLGGGIDVLGLKRPVDVCVLDACDEVLADPPLWIGNP